MVIVGRDRILGRGTPYPRDNKTTSKFYVPLFSFPSDSFIPNTRPSHVLLPTHSFLVDQP